MKSVRNYMMLFLSSYLLSSYATVHTVGQVLYGSVVSKASGKPLSGVYLFTVQGEEEAVTNRQGEFRFTTWEKFPAVIYLRINKNEQVSVRIPTPVKKIAIKL